MGLIGEQEGPGRRAMHILWPAFVMAGVTEALVFAMVDPMDLSWFGGAPVLLSREAIYTLSFLAFWLLFSLASAVTLLLATQPADAAELHPRHWPH